MIAVLRTFTYSWLVGLCTAVAAWVAALVLVGGDEILTVDAFALTFGWESVLGAATAFLVLGVIMALRATVEPVWTALAGAAGFALLYQSRRFPLAESSQYTTASSDYWTLVGSLIAIFSILVIALHFTRDSRS